MKLAVVFLGTFNLVCTTALLEYRREPFVQLNDNQIPIIELDHNIEEEAVESEENEDDNSDEPISSPELHIGMRYIINSEEMQTIGMDTRSINPDLFDDAFLLVPELIKKHGYPSERHTVQTSDGYILEMHRIPHSPQNGPGNPKQPVFLMHGLLDSSSTWVIMRPRNGLAYLLADLGYDVWMGNARGNRYSRRHVTFDPDGRRSDRKHFWDFSWREVHCYHEFDIFEMFYTSSFKVHSEKNVSAAPEVVAPT